MQTFLENIKNYNHNLIENKIEKLNTELKRLRNEKIEYENKKSDQILETIEKFIKINEHTVLEQLNRLNKLHHDIEQTKIKINKYKIVEQNLKSLLVSEKIKKINNHLSCLNDN